MDVAPPRSIEPSLTRIVQVLAIVIAAGTLMAGLLVLATTGGFSVSVPLVPAEGRTPDAGDAQGYGWLVYDSVRLAGFGVPAGAEALRLSAYALYGLVILAGCAIAFLLARRIRDGRPFSHFAAAALAALGVLAIVSAFASPALLLESTFVIVQNLGFELYDASTGSYLDAGSPGATETLWPDRFDRLGPILRHVDWLLAGFGGILVVVSFAFRRGERLQRDSEGLV